MTEFDPLQTSPVLIHPSYQIGRDETPLIRDELASPVLENENNLSNFEVHFPTTPSVHEWFSWPKTNIRRGHESGCQRDRPLHDFHSLDEGCGIVDLEPGRQIRFGERADAHHSAYGDRGPAVSHQRRPVGLSLRCTRFERPGTIMIERPTRPAVKDAAFLIIFGRTAISV